MSNVTVTIPAEYVTAIASADQSYTVNLAEASDIPGLVAHLVAHALKQKLGDSAAGAKAAVDEGTYPDTRTASREMVAKRMKTILTVPTPGAERAATMSPLEKEVVAIVAAFAKSRGAKGSDIPRGIGSAREYIEGYAGDQFETKWATITSRAQIAADAKADLAI